MELYDGEDTTIYASDWPHHDFDHPMKVNQVPFSEEQRRKVFGENALELFGIDRTGAGGDRGRRRARWPTSRPGRTRSSRRGRREIGVFNIAGRFYGLPNLCPTRPARCARAAR